MTERRAQTGGESDPSEETLLTDALIAPRLDEEGVERIRAAAAQEWFAVTSATRANPSAP
jgi:hypothetical protein